MTIKNYAYFFENITMDTALTEYEKIFDVQAKFKDPFNEVQGVEKIYEIFQDMYLTLDNPKFEIIETVSKENFAYLKWNFVFSLKNDSQKKSFEGVSRVEFNKEGKAISHIDFWDAGENVYEKIPILSFFIKLIKRKIKI